MSFSIPLSVKRNLQITNDEVEQGDMRYAIFLLRINHFTEQKEQSYERQPTIYKIYICTFIYKRVHREEYIPRDSSKCPIAYVTEVEVHSQLV